MVALAGRVPVKKPRCFSCRAIPTRMPDADLFLEIDCSEMGYLSRGL